MKSRRAAALTVMCLFCSGIFSPAMATAQSDKEQCPEKMSDAHHLSGHFEAARKDVFDGFTVTIWAPFTKNGAVEYSHVTLAATYGDKNKILPYLGEDVEITYAQRQYWDVVNDICVREDYLTHIAKRAN